MIPMPKISNAHTGRHIDGGAGGGSNERRRQEVVDGERKQISAAFDWRDGLVYTIR